jgi:uncharacterized protein (TIGR02145 family)
MRTHLILQILFLLVFNPLFAQDQTGSFTDSRDGKVYKTVKIGDQWWMAENLAWLPEVDSIGKKTSLRYSVYGYKGQSVAEAKATDYYKTYGVLYNWKDALTVCPDGWHLPSEEEWFTLEVFLGLDPESVLLTGCWKGRTTIAGYENPGNGNSGIIVIIKGIKKEVLVDWGVGSKLKESGYEHWKKPKRVNDIFNMSVGTNSSGFNALPGGVHNIRGIS